MIWDGAKFRTLVKEKGMTLTELANRLNVSRQAVNDWTKNQVPKGSHLIKISKVLDVNPGYFFPEETANQISVPLHRTRGVAKVTLAMEQDAMQMVKDYENLFRFAPAPGLVPVLKINRRDHQSAIDMAKELRKLADVESDKPLNYEQNFALLSTLKIVIIFRDFPQNVKGYAFYCKVYKYRVVFVNNMTNILDLIFPLLHETIHAIRDGDGILAYDQEEEDFCDSVAGSIQFSEEYVKLVYEAIKGRRESHQINLLKEFCAKNGHSMFGIAEELKKMHPTFGLNVAGANANLRKEFPCIGDILFEDQDPQCYVNQLKTLTPLFFEIVSQQISNATTRKIGEWLGLESSLDVKEVIEEWRRVINCT
jgi:transcriptional regulator with XRE-family HTH domain